MLAHLTLQVSISIIIPAYNAQKYIEYAIQSALNQTVKTEIIVIDDGSTDTTAALVRKYPVTLILQNNYGVYKARAAGVEAATGDYILSLDADDQLKYNACETLIQHLDMNRVDIIQFQEMEYTSNDITNAYNSTRIKFLDEPFDLRKRAFELDYKLRGKLIKRSIWMQVLNISTVYQKVSYHSDFAVFIPAAMLSKNYKQLDYRGYYHQIGVNGSMSHLKDDRLVACYWDTFYVIEKVYKTCERMYITGQMNDFKILIINVYKEMYKYQGLRFKFKDQFTRMVQLGIITKQDIIETQKMLEAQLSNRIKAEL
ncbi:Glycosyl_transferase family 2 protein [Hexamita inflata]|uniref:Glycosyl transferase family 2 protein n=1 Tax=Hexamita inflata TaxID=28002 RepID=A0AA86UKU1_9EUKA|nr:Glycosyl transferase family 2 protein [Hexamita inflata]